MRDWYIVTGMSSTAPDPNALIVRLATPADAPAIAALHMHAFTPAASDLSPLGPAVVRLFYTNVLERDLARAVVGLDAGGALLGFGLITRDISAMFTGALLSGPRDIARFLLSVSPAGFARALWTKLASGTAQVGSVPEFVYLAVSATARGRGVGETVMRAGHEEFRRMGIPSFELNVHVDNEPGVKLYLALGYRVRRRYRKGGRDMYNMLRTADPLTGEPLTR
jgi:ribosomal protein S18 acetylase RimI-like enzyme